MKKKIGIIRKVWAPLAIYLAFFIIKAIYATPELLTTGLALVAIGLTFALWYNSGEIGLFIIGILLGLFIEIGLTGVSAAPTQQIWLEVSFFGIPYWLPLAWGIAFVTLPRVGIYLRTLNVR